MSNIPSQQQLIDNALSYLKQALLEAVDVADPKQLAALDAKLSRENNDVFSFVTGTAIHGNYIYLQKYLAKQFHPLSATDEFFSAWAQATIGGLKPANPAEGIVRFTGENGRLIDENTELEKDAITYLTIESGVIDQGHVDIKIVATRGGIDTNLNADEILSLVNPITGVDTNVTVGVDDLLRGSDAETIDQARERMRHWFRHRPLGGAPHDYEIWAMRVPGITRAKGLRTPAGPATAGVIIMADGNDNYGIPTPADAQAVYDYIRDDARGPADELFVYIPEPIFIDIKLRIKPDNAANREAVETELRDLFFREAALGGGSIPHTHLTEAVSIAGGEYTHEFIQPQIQTGASLTSGVYQILILKNVEFVI